MPQHLTPEYWIALARANTPNLTEVDDASHALVAAIRLTYSRDLNESDRWRVALAAILTALITCEAEATARIEEIAAKNASTRAVT